jgi:repressor LexA
MKDLTERQSEVYQFILDFVGYHSYPPTVREIAGSFKISVKAAHDHLSALKKKNRIKVNSIGQRTMEIVSGAGGQSTSSDTFQNIPILGEVAAGKRILCEEHYEGSVKMFRSALKNNKQYFALKVKGDSMTGIGVMDGDTVIIEKKETAKNGDVVVVDIDGGRTLKRFVKQEHRVKLVSENPKYPPTYSTDVRVLGRLAAVYRNCI